jgi:hypothetical protein
MAWRTGVAMSLAGQLLFKTARLEWRTARRDMIIVLHMCGMPGVEKRVPLRKAINMARWCCCCCCCWFLCHCPRRFAQ